VLAALNAATADDPLILTCRTAEYEAAISRSGGAVLTGGAVIEPDPLRLADVAHTPTGSSPRIPESLS
jgi:hypothetical protein